MVICRCRFCGSTYDEEKEEVPVRELKVCPVCRVTSGKLVPAGGVPSMPRNESRLSGSVSAPAAPMSVAPASAVPAPTSPERREALPYDPEYVRLGMDSRYMDEIHEVAIKGKPIIAVMGTQMSMPGWDDILFLSAQLDPIPLDEHVSVKMETTIGKEAKKPMVSKRPVYISHMSFGALSKETETTLIMDSAMTCIAMYPGGGGILPREREAAYKYISEYVSNLYGVSGENLRRADAIEIKVGQDIKPGMGDHLPGSKVTPEIAVVCGKPLGRDAINPSRFPRIDSKEDLETLVDRLREESGGGPIGIRIVAGRIEKDLESCVYAGSDFITIDDRDGATGASPKLVGDSASVSTIHAPYRARKHLGEVGMDMEPAITGGFRVSSDLAKALAMGADAAAIASAALIAAARQRYHVCGTGMCPVRVATQDKVLRRHLPMDAAAQRVANFLSAFLEGIGTFARTAGHHNIYDMDVDDLCTTNREIPEFTNTGHAQSSRRHRLIPGLPHEAVHP